MDKHWYEMIKFFMDDEFQQLPDYLQKCIQSNAEDQSWLKSKEGDPAVTDIDGIDELRLQDGERIRTVSFYAGKLTHRCPDYDGSGFVNCLYCARCRGWGIEYLDNSWKPMAQLMVEETKIFRLKKIEKDDVEKILQTVNAKNADAADGSRNA
ncbi:MAG: hypothetical protein ACTTKL_10380 [Treponema sp.]